MINEGNKFSESNYNMKLKTFWTQCISLLFLVFVISFALNIFKFDLTRLIMEVILIIAIAIMFIMSYKTKKLKPYHYIMLLFFNFFVVVLLFILDDMSKITVFSYFSIIILFTVVLFNKIERIIFGVIECILYSIISIYYLQKKLVL